MPGSRSLAAPLVAARLVAAGLAASVLVVLLTVAGRAAACPPELSEAGLGGITGATPFDRDVIALAVPGCTVEPGAGSSEGEPLDILVIKNGGTPIALVFPDWTGGVFSVLVQSPAVRTPLGPAIGQPFARIYDRAASPSCIPGVEDSSGRVLCPSAPGARLAYVFEGAWSGPDGTLPTPEVLADWTLVALLWRPVPFEDPRWVDVAGFDPGEGPALAARVREAVGDPPRLAALVLYPITLRATDAGGERAIDIPDAGTFAAEYGRRLTPAFVSAVRDEAAGRVHIDDNGAALGSGRIWIAPVCATESCVEHRSGVIAVSMF